MTTTDDRLRAAHDAMYRACLGTRGPVPRQAVEKAVAVYLALDPPLVPVPLARCIETTGNHGGYRSGKCVACGAQGWLGQIGHDLSCAFVAAGGRDEP